MKYIVKTTLYLLLFNQIQCYSQTIFNEQQNKFLEYLNINHLTDEKIQYLKELKGIHNEHKDTINFLLSKTFHEFNNTDSALIYINQVHNSFLVKTNLFKFKLGLLLQANDTINIIQLLNSISINNSNFDKELDILKFIISNSQKSINNESLSDIYPFDICNKIEKHQLLMRKKTALAVLYSTIIPGVGKIYLGRKRDGYNMLALNFATGLMATESLLKKGLLSLYTIPSLTLFTVFYLGNIYGTYKAVKILKHDSYKNLLLHIGMYYHNK